MTESMLDVIRGRLESFRKIGITLIKEYAGLHPINDPHDFILVINPCGDQSWNPLPTEGKRIQARFLPEWDRFSEIVCRVSLSLPDSVRGEIEGTCRTVRETIAQEEVTWAETIDEAVRAFSGSIDNIARVLDEYFGAKSENVLVLPDTNALISNSDMEHWTFDGVAAIEIVLTPTILAELDRLKMEHRNESVRRKCEKLVRRIKEYRRRGPLHEGVSLVTGMVSLRTVAVEPNMGETLSWFDAANSDDRFLASALEVIRRNLDRPLFIVTGDINMQNKAEFSGIPYREVPAAR